MERVIYRDLGRIDYQEAWDLQGRLLKESVERKRLLRDSENEGMDRLHYLLFCEHPPVYTLGKSGSADNLLLTQSELEAKGISYYPINRGGDITYHGPGQVVGYPIFDLDGFFTDIHRYVRTLEEIVIQVMEDYGLIGERIEGYTGVWLKNPDRKICAIGVHMSRWVSMHGFAFNVNTDLHFFKHIIPCGIEDEDKDVTSLQKELGREIDVEEIKDKLKTRFRNLFGFEFKSI
ncbi:MAG: lipoyl(octanoyl) transferase LipB [Bacteroidetes bacterium]|nr:lipoyl(octanoyl) transferase LipB [Bacteroidota bacterium]